ISRLVFQLHQAVHDAIDFFHQNPQDPGLRLVDDGLAPGGDRGLGETESQPLDGEELSAAMPQPAAVRLFVPVVQLGQRYAFGVGVDVPFGLFDLAIELGEVEAVTLAREHGLRNGRRRRHDMSPRNLQHGRQGRRQATHRPSMATFSNTCGYATIPSGYLLLAFWNSGSENARNSASEDSQTATLTMTWLSAVPWCSCVEMNPGWAFMNDASSRQVSKNFSRISRGTVTVLISVMGPV